MAVIVAQHTATRWVSVGPATVSGGQATCGMIPGCACAVKILADFLRPSLAPEIPRLPSRTGTLDAWLARARPDHIQHHGAPMSAAERRLTQVTQASTGLRTYVDDIRKWARGTAREVADMLAASVLSLQARLETDGMK